MRIAVLGESGQLASSLQRAVSGKTATSLTCLGRTRLDLAAPFDPAALAAAAPHIVINTAAYTAVDQAESDEAAAFQLNAAAPDALARWCAGAGVALIHVSTDYVFSGEPGRAWREDDAAMPATVYGRTKRAGEEAVLASGANALVVRTAWLHGARSGTFVTTMLRLAEERGGAPLPVVDDQIGCPTSADDLADALLAVAALAIAGDAPHVLHLAGAGGTSWADFARAIFVGAERRGLIAAIPEVRNVTSEAFPRPAPRPKNSVLDGSRAAALGVSLPGWRVGLARTLDRLAREAV